MAHIHTKPGQHDLTASAYIIRDDGNEPVVLLHRHKKLGAIGKNVVVLAPQSLYRDANRQAFFGGLRAYLDAV